MNRLSLLIDLIVCSVLECLLGVLLLLFIFL
jgi:hypothetical protein